MIRDNKEPKWSYYQTNNKNADENYREQLIQRQKNNSHRLKGRTSQKEDDDAEIMAEIEKQIEDELSKIVDDLFKNWK